MSLTLAVLLVLGWLVPVLVRAQAFDDAQSFVDFIIGTIINPLIPVLVGIALVYFLFGVYKFVASAANERERESGRLYMLYGIIGLFVMLGVWGLLAILTGTFGLQLMVPQFG
jgi:hypothetical protein